MYQIGCGKADITAFVKGAGMLGYGMYFHTMEGVETPLYARSFIVVDDVAKTKLTMVNCELGFITISLKKGVLAELERRLPNGGFNEENLMMTAQHTHSGPGGYSYYGLYNISIPGFVNEVYQKLVNGIVDSVVAAEKNLQPGSISFSKGNFDLDVNVSFNRSLHQYNQNPEVTEKLTPETTNRGVNREMALLKFTAADGKDLGSINWFGVHTTSVSNDLNKICSDNKGYASQFFEEDKGNGYIAAFAQGICGDVTPRFKYNPKRKYQRGYWEGEYQDDYKSAQFNGRLQFEKAKELAEDKATKASELNGGLDCGIQYVDFTRIQCDPEFTNGNLDARTGPAAMGMAFFGGAYIDGPGAHPVIVKVGNAAARVIKSFEKTKAFFLNGDYKKIIDLKYKVQGNKSIVIETNARRMLGTKHINRLIIPAWAEPSIYLLKKFFEKEGNRKKPWTARVMPIQVFVIDSVALVAFPFEITTIAAKRLKSSVEKRLKERGVKEVIIAPYANSYSGYITTFEEYQVQMYEGGHTVFGEWSLAGLQTKFDELCKAMLANKEERNILHDDLPPEFTEDELNQFPFYKAAWYARKERRAARKNKTAV
jgi:neutral ceramidase